ncbi:MAG: hypothetical protein AAGE52_35120 [Myxococcota bacterium]
MPKIRTSSGRESEFSAEILRKWVASELRVSEVRTEAIVEAVAMEIAERESLSSAELLEITAQHSLALEWSPDDLARLPLQGLAAAEGLSTASFLAAVSRGSRDFVSPVLRPYVDCIGKKLDKSWKFQAPAGWAKTVDGDDDDAPRVVGVGAGVVECCDAEVGIVPPRRQVRGLKIPLHLSFTDRDSGEDSSGVVRVSVTSIVKVGDEVTGPLIGPERWRVNDAARTRTKTGSASHTFEICVPCTVLDDRRRAFFGVKSRDGAGNQSLQVVSVVVPQAVVDQCCGGGGGGNNNQGGNGGGQQPPGGGAPGGAPGACPCYVKLFHIPVGGDSASSILGVMGSLFVKNPYNRTFYHSALEVQRVENGECVRYVIELQNYVEGAQAQQDVGQVLSGGFGPFVSAFAGRIYGIRKWKNGEIEDIDTAAPNPRVVTDDCNAVDRVLALVTQIPTHDYGTDWTSNSVISWLLERAGLNPNTLPPPPGGIRPGWEEGAAAANN